MSRQNKQGQGHERFPRTGEATAEAAAVGSAPTVATSSWRESDLSAPPRLRTADRQQLLSPKTIDELLDADHPARAVWRFALGLDLAELYDRIRARGSEPGRPAIDPRILVALWLYATLQGFTSCRDLAELCVHHDAYRWLAGGITANYHTLSDFRVGHPDFLQNLLDHSVQELREKGLIDLDRVAQDGVRVRASAGAASFRTRETLERLLQEAQAEVQRLQQELDRTVLDAGVPQESQGPQEKPSTPAEPGATQEVASSQESTTAATEPSAQQRAARRRHAKDRLARMQAALERMPEMEAKKKKAEEKNPEKKDKKARVSTTDPQATVMKMADGGYRPAYNVQFSTTCQGMVIVGVEVTTEGTDHDQLHPMLDQIEDRFEHRPQEALVDGGYAGHDEIEKVQAGEKRSKVYAPVPKPRKEEVDRYEAKRSDTPEVAEWRQRMGTEEAKEIYKQRGATAECVNAQARNRGLKQFVVRGLEKVRSIALWFAAVHNMVRGFSLQPQPLPTG